MSVDTFDEIRNNNETVEVDVKALERLLETAAYSYPQNAIDRVAIARGREALDRAHAESEP